MALEAGKAFIKIVYDSKSNKASLQAVKGETEKELAKWGEKVGKLSAKALVGGLSAIGTLAAASVKNYAEFEQISGGIQKIFNDMDYKKIEKDARQAYKTMNISASEYMEQISGVGATFAQTMGDKKGYETAKKGMQALADYASGTGKSVDLLMDKYQAITRSTSSYLSIADQFAGILPQTTDGFLKQAKASGYLTGNYKKLSEVPVAEYQKALSAMLEDGVKEMGLLGNTAEETEKTITGSLNATKASLQNVITDFLNGGDSLDQSIDDLFENLSNLVKNVVPKFFEAFGNIYKEIFERAPVVTIFATALAGVAAAITAITVATKIWTAVTTVAKTVAIATNFVIAHSPIFLVAGAIALVIAGIVLLVTHIKEVGDWFMWLGNIIGAFFGDFSAKALEVIDGFQQGFRNAIENVKNWFASIPAFFAGIFNKITGLFKSIGTKIGEVVSGAFKGVVNGIISFIEGFLNTPIDAVNGLIDTINSVPGVDIPRLNRMSLPRLAKGGLATGSTLANIGEAGKEAVIPLERNTENWARPLAHAIAEQFSEQGIGGAGITVYMTNNINNNLDADEIGRRLMTSIRRAA